ncbi:pentapeptide repeat-containing protein, partial [Paracoccaceae bacterium]|nr:pentapeptide repeat-containing protein [Paracoccaceae bacterium]
MKRLLATVAVAAALVESNASAFDPADLKIFKKLNSCTKCNLPSVNLTEANLSGADLYGSNLMGA